MLEPDELLDAIVSAYRSCPDIVTEMNGDGDRIRAYRDSIEKTNIRSAILQLGAPGILVIYDGDAMGSFDGHLIRKYQFSVVYRGLAKSKDESPSGTGHLRYLLEAAKLAGSEQRIRYASIHPLCYEMEPTTAARESVVVSLEGDTVDYWRVKLTLTENGDN